MSVETVAVTGGNGRIGEAIIEELNDHGYRTVDLARGKRRESVADEYRTTDLLDPGEVYGSLAVSEADAAIHMGTLPSPTRTPEHVTFESNANSTYHVLEAATALDLEAVCLPSSINAMGASFQDEPIEVDYLPVDEDHRLTPRDPYAMGKQTVEVIGDGFGRREDAPATIASLRYPWVAYEEELRERFVEGDRTLDGSPARAGGANELFTYLHLADAARVARATIEADFRGHEAFWAVAADTSMETPSGDLARRVYPDADVRGDLDGHRSLVSVEKAERLLGWTPERSWRDL